MCKKQKKTWKTKISASVKCQVRLGLLTRHGREKLPHFWHLYCLQRFVGDVRKPRTWNMKCLHKTQNLRFLVKVENNPLLFHRNYRVSRSGFIYSCLKKTSLLLMIVILTFIHALAFIKLFVWLTSCYKGSKGSFSIILCNNKGLSIGGCRMQGDSPFIYALSLISYSFDWLMSIILFSKGFLITHIKL